MAGPYAISYWLIGGGGVLLAFSTILPWISVVLIGDLSLFRLATAAHSVDVLPLAMVATGVGLAGAAFRGTAIHRLAMASAIAVGLLALAGGSDLVDLVRAVHASEGLAGLGSGVYVAVISLILIAVGSARVYRGARPSIGIRGVRRPSGRITHSPPFDRAPGWKQDPWGVTGTMRYWDGHGWTREVSHWNGRDWKPPTT